MNVNVLNQEGKEVGKAVLPKEIFEVEMNQDLVQQVVLAQQANRRQKTAKTKDRAQVRGGGRKPWRQKGTGRARHGSIRSPLWKGGGVTFGPTGKEVFKKKIPSKMRKKALFMVLSEKARQGFLIVVDDLKLEKAKTKLMADILQKLFLKKGSGLVALPDIDEALIKSTRNIAGAKTIQAKDLNALSTLSFKYLLMPKESIKVIKETFLK